MRFVHRSPSGRTRPLRGLVLGLALGITSAAVIAAGAQNETVRIFQGPGPIGGGGLPRDAADAPRPPAAGTAIVAGMVVSADGGRPVRRATVRLSSTTPALPMSTTTDDQGTFRFEKVPAGQFTLTTSKPGYLDSIYGQRRAGSGRPGTPLAIAEGQRVDRLSLSIARGGVLAGTITDDNGEPAFGADVRALKFTWQGGERVLRIVGADRADDRGGFRIGALPPGDYIVMATPLSEMNQMTFSSTSFAPANAIGVVGGFTVPPVVRTDPRDAVIANDTAPSSGYAPVYYPGTTSASGATPIALGLGEERAGLDLQTPLLRMGRVRGSITSDGSRAVIGTEVRLIDLDQALPGLGVRSTVANQNGQFVFDDVAPGRYRVQAHSGPRNLVMVEPAAGGNGGGARVMQFMSASTRPGSGDGGVGGAPSKQESEQLWALSEVAINGGDTQTLSLFLQPGMTVSGRVTFDNTGQPLPDPRGIRIVLNAARQNELSASSAIGQVQEDGSFTIAGVIPGTHRINVLAPGGWRPRSFDVAGRDALDVLLDVPADRGVSEATLTMTTRAARLTGSITEAAGSPGTGYTIIVFSADPAYWTPQSRRIQATRPSTDGRFALANLPAGDYRLVALDDLEDGQWFDPAVLRQIAGGALLITLGDGENKTQDIRVSR